MQSYPLKEIRDRLKEIRDRQREMLDQAEIEPILLIEDSQPKYVILSAQEYQQLIVRLSKLEEITVGQLAEAALQNSRMVGSETFTAELQRIAAMENHDG